MNYQGKKNIREKIMKMHKIKKKQQKKQTNGCHFKELWEVKDRSSSR